METRRSGDSGSVVCHSFAERLTFQTIFRNFDSIAGVDFAFSDATMLMSSIGLVQVTRYDSVFRLSETAGIESLANQSGLSRCQMAPVIQRLSSALSIS